MATKSAEQISKVLSEIQSRIPRNLIKNAVSEVKLTPTVEFVMDKALEDPKISEEKKAKIRTLKENGEFSKMTYRNNERVQKQINNFVEREIKKAIKDGRLPHRNDIKNVDIIKHIYEKANIKKN